MLPTGSDVRAVCARPEAKAIVVPSENDNAFSMDDLWGMRVAIQCDDP